MSDPGPGEANAIANLDSNRWWHISEERVDLHNATNFRNTLQWVRDGDNRGLRVFSMVAQSWQMYLVDEDIPGRYILRLNVTDIGGIGRHLGVCYDADDEAASRTVACLERATESESQQWDVRHWGDGGSYKFYNVANGSDYVLDVHPGSNLFMSDRIEGENSDADHPAQHWVFSSGLPINDGSWSTIYPLSTQSSASSAAAPSSTGDGSNAASNSPSSNPATPTGDNSVPSATGSPPAAETSSGSGSGSSGGLSAGAAAGIGVGATIGAAALIGGLVFLWWRRKNRGANHSAKPVELSGSEYAYNGGHGGMHPGAHPGTHGSSPVYSPSSHMSTPSPFAPHQQHSPPPQGEKPPGPWAAHPAQGHYGQDMQHGAGYPAPQAPAQIHEAPSNQYNELDASTQNGNGGFYASR